MTFTQLVGGVIGIAISSTLFNTQLIKNLAISAPNAPPSVLTSVLSIRDIDPTLQAGVIVAYVKALNVVYILGIPAGLLAGLSGTSESLRSFNFALTHYSLLRTGLLVRDLRLVYIASPRIGFLLTRCLVYSVKGKNLMGASG